MGAAFVDGLDGSGREDEGDCFLELRHINAFFLEIRVLANKPGRIELGGAGAVRVAASYLRTLLIYGANSRHLRQLT